MTLGSSTLRYFAYVNPVDRKPHHWPCWVECGIRRQPQLSRPSPRRTATPLSCPSSSSPQHRRGKPGPPRRWAPRTRMEKWNEKMNICTNSNFFPDFWRKFRKFLKIVRTFPQILTLSTEISKKSAKFSSKSSRKSFIFHSANEISFFILQNLMQIVC